MRGSLCAHMFMLELRMILYARGFSLDHDDFPRQSVFNVYREIHDAAISVIFSINLIETLK